MNAATASEIARLETMTITKLVDRFESTLKTTSRAIMLNYLRKALFQRSRRASSWMSYHGSVIQWRRLGYRVILYFIWLPNPELAIQRVAKRVREGGHNIPETVVRRRYARGLANLADLYIPIVNTTCVFDGASFPPIQIAVIDGEKELVLDYNSWERIQLHRKEASND